VATASAVGSTPDSPRSTGRPRITKVLTVVEENHGLQSASRGMPYLASLAAAYGSTTGYGSLTHPSLPNYLAMAGGSTFGVQDDAGPSSHPLSGPSVFDVALSAGRTAATYAESMTRPCQTTSAGPYAVKHNPWAYFSDPGPRQACLGHDVPAGTPAGGALRSAIARGALPQVGLLVPDLCHDAHDCSLATADAWLRGWMQLLLAGPDYRAGRLAVVITFDEVDGGGSGHLLTAVVAPALHRTVVDTSLSHLSWARWMTDLVGARPLRSAGGATSLGRAFGLS
jgi:hypothetical protein